MDAGPCANCGKPVSVGSAFCTQCGTRVAPVVPSTVPSAPVPTPTPARPRTCGNCRTQMTGMGEVSFRAGARPRPAGATAGSAETGADALQPFSLYYCPQCGKFDLYYPGT